MLLAALAAGCASVEVTRPAPEPATPEPVDQRAQRWQFDAGMRPPADRDGYRPPIKLAVLLPLTGSLATPAKPVRDGLLAGYYAESRRRPELVFYDTGSTSGGAGAAYAKAVAEGADQVLGPLGRDEIDAVYRGVQASAPVIALNRSTAEQRQFLAGTGRRRHRRGRLPRLAERQARIGARGQRRQRATEFRRLCATPGRT